ncbi:CDP-alcohol phosphatidyltransferase family protein [Jidongwangia harbinensis]|uniref:CDP-alcohol phosphatidyltransferase family protein n=1 Tax=Jidongwangia harbinensis TaxID=2878561 RepID=UPI001CD9ACE6|nr:CDP-alcohol phosphatidyltransferase family protein [Jidongwangia harbinensis]MCA2212436.1 CDP-alcohol phosphatidyltransferase family protein [Jidongwangia harbinensis]
MRASPVVRGWIRLAYSGGVLLARLRVGPTAVTLAGLVLCLAVPVAVRLGPVGLLLGAVLVLLAGLADAFDGAVAVVTGKAGRAGFVIDSVADRIGEAAWLVAFWLAGVPGWLAVAAGGVSWLHEYLRARAATAGMPDIGVVTVAERPTRVSVAVTGLLAGGAAGLVRDDWGAPVVTIAAAVWLTLGVVGFAQLVRAVRRALS